MLQIYVVFSLKTTIHVHICSKNGHDMETCPFFMLKDVFAAQGLFETAALHHLFL
jgi:hypothetical protein